MSENKETYESLVKRRNELEKQLAKMAAEAESVKSRMQLLVDIVNNADNSYCMCGSAMKDHDIYGCGSPAGMFDYHYGKWIESEDETPVTDEFTRELMARGGADALEKFAEFNINSIDDSDSEYTEVLIEVARVATGFAAQLRKGINDAQ